MRVILNDYIIESNFIVFDYYFENTDEDHRRMYIRLDDFKNQMLDMYRHRGLNNENFAGFLDKSDPKYKINDDYVVSYILWYHKF